jgi:hypothetical protein
LLIDERVDQEQLAGSKRLDVVLVERYDFDRTARHRTAIGLKLAFRKSEHHRGRLRLSDDHERRRIAGMNNAAEVNLTDAGAAADRRDDCGVIELSPGAFNRRLIGLDRSLQDVDLGLLLIDHLLGFKAADDQGFGP